MRTCVPASFPGSIPARRLLKVVSDWWAQATRRLKSKWKLQAKKLLKYYVMLSLISFVCALAPVEIQIYRNTTKFELETLCETTFETQPNRTPHHTRHVCYETSWNHVRSHILLGFVRCDWLVRRPRHIHLYHFIYRHICDIIDYIETTTE